MICIIIIVGIIFGQITQQLRNIAMPSVFEFLQNPELFPYESTLSSNPQLLNCLIDFITKNPDPLLHNEQQCYVYPNKSAEILALGTTYRAIIVKKERKNKKTGEMESCYPYLDKMFKNLEIAHVEESLLGYCNRVLISLAKKTPQIYQFIKDNQDVIGLITKNNPFLRNFKQFIATFLIQSTMGLYVFLKNVVIRSLMFRIIDEKDIQNLVVYETLLYIYSQINKKLKSKILPEDQKQQLQQICVNFHDQDFITLLILKVSSKKSDKTFLIGKLLNQIASSPDHKLFAQTSASHMQAIQQYFETYQQSSGFLDCLMPDQIQILKLLQNLSQKGYLQAQHEANLLKRLLVYTSIHKRNSVLHNLLFKVIQIVTQENRTEVFNQINLIPFLIKNYQIKGCRYAYGSLVYRICLYWSQNQSKLGKYVGQEDKQFIKQQIERRNKKLQNLTLYKQIPNKSELVSQQSLEQKQSPQSSPSHSQQKQEQEQASPQKVEQSSST